MNRIGKRVLIISIVVAAWLITAALGIYEIVLVRDLFFRLFSHFMTAGVTGYEAISQANIANSAGILLVLILAIIWITAFIGGAEYHRRHLGEPGSWKLFTRTLAAELAILLLVFFI